jgi:hypothetical protein
MNDDAQRLRTYIRNSNCAFLLLSAILFGWYFITGRPPPGSLVASLLLWRLRHMLVIVWSCIVIWIDHDRSNQTARPPHC